jgi:hypothetical protein
MFTEKVTLTQPHCWRVTGGPRHTKTYPEGGGCSHSDLIHWDAGGKVTRARSIKIDYPKSRT